MVRKLVWCTVAACGVGTAYLVLAGPLNPPAGSVSGTYKTLTEVEPRIAINGSNTPGDADSLYKIVEPGSYYLTRNVTAPIGKHGIEIAAGGVTIDLNGFELVGVTGFDPVHGIVATSVGLADVSVRGGTVRDWPGNGVSLGANVVSGGSVSGVTARNNVQTGIFVHSYFRVSGCHASGNGQSGIWAVNSSILEGCTSSGNGGDGIQAGDGHTIIACVSYNNGASGIRTGPAATITNCSSYANASGIVVSGSGSVEGCLVRSNDGDGVFTSGTGCVVARNTITNNGTVSGAGVHVAGSDARIEGNHCENNAVGIDVDGSRNRIDGNSCVSNRVSFSIGGSDNFVVRNSASGGAPNYSIGAGNSVAPRVSVADSDGWSGITNADHPWANFGH